MKRGIGLWAFIVALLGWSATSIALSPAASAMNEQVAPFRIVGNLYYVGASDVASYLLVTPGGNVLIDGGFAETADQIEKNIEKLGFRVTDVKWLLNGHAHPDHAGGLAKLKRDSGAQFAAMDAEVLPLEHSGQGTFYRGDRVLFESISVDRVLHDRDHIDLGAMRLTALQTPGHTPGCTTWTVQVMDGAKLYHVVIVCQISVPAEIALVGDAAYPSIQTDFERTFAELRALPCDVFLAEHGSAFSLKDKMARAAIDPSTNPFIDPQGFARYVSDSETEFRKQISTAHKPTP